MGHRHRRRTPEGKQKSRVEGVSDHAIEERRYECRPNRLLAAQVSPNLLQAKELEMVNQERRHQHDTPTACESRIQNHSPHYILNAPNHATERLPERDQCQQRKTAGKYKGRALDRRTNDSCELLLECYARHSAVLQRKQRKQP